MRPAETEVELSEVQAKGEPWTLVVRELTEEAHTVNLHTLATVSDLFRALKDKNPKFASCQLVLGGKILENNGNPLSDIKDEVNNGFLRVLPAEPVSRSYNSNRLFSAVRKSKKPETRSTSQPSRCSIM